MALQAYGAEGTWLIAKNWHCQQLGPRSCPGDGLEVCIKKTVWVNGRLTQTGECEQPCQGIG